MNLKEIKELINLMNENGLEEVEIEKEGSKIRLKKEHKGHEYSPPAITPPMHLTPMIPPSEQTPSAKPPSQAQSEAIQIKAPMVGTFYRAPSPESPPFVEIGQTIEAGQVVCIIEAMKLMNEIKSEVKGKIIDVLVENGEPVEYDQPMFLIEPS